jgi:hypothetical protein
MSTTLKALIGVGAALVFGLLGGFLLGRCGKSEAEEALLKTKRRAAEIEETAKREGEECAQRDRVARVGKQLLLTKEELLRAMLELAANNFGLTSQHLGQARSWLRAAEKNLKPVDAKRARELFDKIGEAQTLAMRLDPMSRVYIERILADLQRLPGAR